ncbi:hypothetical protein HOH51_01675, partial [bacterium]|nr:hypothetical protein [bacterium]
MNLEKQLSELLNQPSYSKKNKLYSRLVSLEKFRFITKFIKASWFFKFKLKYKLYFSQSFADITYVFAKKSMAVGLSFVFVLSILATPFLSTNNYINNSQYLLSRLSGDVQVLRAGNLLSVDNEFELQALDVVTTSSKSLVEVRVLNGAIVRLGQNSQLYLGNVSKSPFLNTVDLELSKGSFWLNSSYNTLVPTKINLSTASAEFELYKSSKFAVKTNSEALIAYNFSRPVLTHTLSNSSYLGQSQVMNVSEEKTLDIFKDNMLAFMSLNSNLDKTIYLDVSQESSSQKHRIAGILPNQIMYPIEVLQDWFNSKVNPSSNVDSQIDHVSESLIETELMLAQSNSDLDSQAKSSLKIELSKVVESVKETKQISQQLHTSTKENLISQLTNIESSISKDLAPQTYFELKSLLSNAKLDVSESFEEQSQLALENTNQILTEISLEDAQFQKQVLPNVLDELTFALDKVSMQSTLVSNSGMIDAKLSQDLEFLIRESLVITDMVDKDIVDDSALEQKVDLLRSKIQEVAAVVSEGDSEGIPQQESFSSSVSFETDYSTVTIEEIDTLQIDKILDENNQDIDLDTLESPEQTEADLEPNAQDSDAPLSELDSQLTEGSQENTSLQQDDFVEQSFAKTPEQVFEDS